MGERGSTEDVENREELVLWYIGPDGRKERSDLLQQLLVIGNWWVQNSSRIPASWNAAQRSSPLADPASDVWVFSNLAVSSYSDRSSPRLKLHRRKLWSHVLLVILSTNFAMKFLQEIQYKQGMGYDPMGGHCQLHTNFGSSDCIGSDHILSHLVLAITNRAANWYFEF